MRELKAAMGRTFLPAFLEPSWWHAAAWMFVAGSCRTIVQWLLGWPLLNDPRVMAAGFFGLVSLGLAGRSTWRYAKRPEASLLDLVQSVGAVGVAAIVAGAVNGLADWRRRRSLCAFDFGECPAHLLESGDVPNMLAAVAAAVLFFGLISWLGFRRRPAGSGPVAT